MPAREFLRRWDESVRAHRAASVGGLDAAIRSMVLDQRLLALANVVTPFGVGMGF